MSKEILGGYIPPESEVFLTGRAGNYRDIPYVVAAKVAIILSPSEYYGVGEREYTARELRDIASLIQRALVQAENLSLIQRR